MGFWNIYFGIYGAGPVVVDLPAPGCVAVSDATLNEVTISDVTLGSVTISDRTLNLVTIGDEACP